MRFFDHTPEHIVEELEKLLQLIVTPRVIDGLDAILRGLGG